MKRKITVLVVLVIVLALGSAAYIYAVGNEYTLSFQSNKYEDPVYENIQVSYEKEGIVTYKEERENNGYLELRFSKESKGVTKITIACTVRSASDSNSQSKEEQFEDKLTVGSFGIIYHEKGFGDFTGYESIVVALVIFMFAVAAMMLSSYRRLIKASEYSYIQINYVGIFLLATVIAILSIVQLVGVARNPDSHYQGLYLVCENFLLAVIDIVRYSLPIVVVFSIAMIISNIMLLMRERKRLANVLGIIISIMMLLGGGIFLWLENNMFDKLHLMLMFVYTAVFCFCECMLAGAIVCGITAAVHKPKYDKDYIIILGCGIRKDGTPLPLLQGRIDRAIRFYQEQLEKTGKAAVLIPSGGQGGDECISEAESMKEYMISQGIPEKQILMEDQSKTTLQNMRNSKQLIDHGGEEVKVAFSTTNYHVFRSGLFAESVGLKAEGIASSTKWYFWPNAFIREFVGMLSSYKIPCALELILLGLWITLWGMIMI